MANLSLAVLLILPLLVVVVAYNLSHQLEQQHRELIQQIDALAEMIGEAIDQHERN